VDGFTVQYVCEIPTKLDEKMRQSVELKFIVRYGPHSYLWILAVVKSKSSIKGSAMIVVWAETACNARGVSGF